VKKTIPILGVALLLLLVLACGGGGGSGGSSTETVSVNGSLDFETNSSKPRAATGDNVLDGGEVFLINLSSGETFEATVSGNTYIANVVAGSYVIKALSSDGYSLRRIAPSITSSSNLIEVVDFDSTVVATLIETLKLDGVSIENVSDLSTLISDTNEMEDLYLDSVQILSSTSINYNDATLQAALVALSLKEQMRSDYQNKLNLINDYTISDNQLLDHYVSSTAELFNLAFVSQLTLPGNVIISSNSQLNSSVFSSLQLSTVAQSITSLELNSSLGDINAVIPTRASDYSAGSYSLIQTGSETSIKATLKAYSSSDLFTKTDGRYFYVIGRYFADFIEKFDLLRPSKSLYHFSTIDSDESTMNPQDLIFLPNGHALLTRLGNAVQWVVDPNAKTQTDFKVDELDLSAYDEGDGSPEITSGIVIGDKLYLLAQRLEYFSPANFSPYLIVLNADTLDEIDTRASGSSSNLLGIALPAKNPIGITYNETTDLIYIVCRGQLDFIPPTYNESFSYTGGIVSVDPNTYSANLLTDDGETSSSTGLYGGLINELAIVDADHAFISIYTGVATGHLLKQYDPVSGNVLGDITGFSNVDIAGMSVSPDGNVWMTGDFGLSILDATGNVIQSNLSLGLEPSGSIEFLNP